MKQANGTYIRPKKRFTWWLGSGNYFQYMMRELSSLFIGAFSLVMVWGLYRLSQGPAEYLLWLSNLWDNFLLFSLLCFIFATYHSITWFWVTPKAMPIQIGGKPLPGAVIIGAHIVAWLAVSVIVWCLAMGGMS